jgi:hypothetical protein
MTHLEVIATHSVSKSLKSTLAGGAATTQIGSYCYIRWPEGPRGQITDERALHRCRSSWLHLLCPAWRETGGSVISHAPNHNLSLRCNLAAPLASQYTRPLSQVHGNLENRIDQRRSQYRVD